MTTKDFTANVISATKVVPDGNFKDSKASGIWDINEALDLIKGGNWPNVANINPAAFVDGLFQTHLYTGNDTSQTITNGINLSGEGGMTWLKTRDDTHSNYLFDTERGAGYYLNSDTTGAQAYHATAWVTGFNSDGFDIGYSVAINDDANDHVSWTFRKQPKFFDVVTYSGNGSNQNISHNLGSVPGMIIAKDLSESGSWSVFHRGMDNTEVIYLNSTSAKSTEVDWNNTDPTSSVFTVGNSSSVNKSGNTYVAYLFAHNNDDGGFGEPGDQDIIKCGSYTGTGSTGNSITLGFEPQWIMVKNTSTTTPWVMVDVMRGMPVDGTGPRLLADASDAEVNDASFFAPRANGFEVTKQNTYVNTNNQTYIYMAIRRGGMQTPTAASSVFDVTKTTDNSSTTSSFDVGFVSDFAIHRETDATAVPYAFTRLLGGRKYLRTDGTNAEADSTVTLGYDWTLQNSVENNVDGGSPHIFYNWARARGYFDVVAYTGTGSVRTVTHNLGVVPEMFWVKTRDSTESWAVYHKNIGNSYQTVLNLANARLSDSTSYNNTDPTSSVFTVGTNDQLNKSGDDYIALLFATVSGVSKVGSFTQSGATNVDCGFTGDTPSFILFKRIDSAGSWYVFDSARGIIAGNDPYFYFNTTAAEITNEDIVDPYSGGFATTSSLTNGDYVFYAIAAIS